MQRLSVLVEWHGSPLAEPRVSLATYVSSVVNATCTGCSIGPRLPVALDAAGGLFRLVPWAWFLMFSCRGFNGLSHQLGALVSLHLISM